MRSLSYTNDPVKNQSLVFSRKLWVFIILEIDSSKPTFQEGLILYLLDHQA